MDLRKGKEGGEKMRGREGGRGRRGGGCLSGWVPTPHLAHDGQFVPCVRFVLLQLPWSGSERNKGQYKLITSQTSRNLPWLQTVCAPYPHSHSC